MKWTIRAFWNQFYMKKKNVSPSCLWKKEDRMNSRGSETHSACNSYEANHIMEWDLKLTGKWLSQSIFLNTIFFYYVFVRKSMISDRGEKMCWKSKTWKQHDNYFLLLKNVFLNLFWKIHQIQKFLKYSFSRVVKKASKVWKRQEKVRNNI